MKKIFTLFVAALASVGFLSAQTTITWELTSIDDLSGTSSESSITVSDLSLGSNIHPTTTVEIDTKNHSIETPYVVFSPVEDTAEHKTAKTDGSNLVTMSFTIPAGYTFTPNNLSFYACKNGSGNNHYADIALTNGSESQEVASQYTFIRDNEGGDAANFTITDSKALEGVVTLEFNLYGKSQNTTSKGWVLGNIVLSGQLDNKSDTREFAPISWDVESVSLKVRDNFTSPKLVNDENLEVTFTSGNEAIATVDENGVITLVEGALGTAVISASYDGSADNAAYKSTVVNTTIEVLTNVEDGYSWDNIEPGEDIVLTKSFKAGKTSGSTNADNKLINDANMTARTVYSANYANYKDDFLGQTFSGALQLGRVKAVPSVDTPTGTENSGSSPLEVTAKTDLKLVVFYRRQALEQESKMTEEDDVDKNVITRKHIIGFSANDGKSLLGVDQAAPADLLDSEQVLGKYIGDVKGHDDYLYVASIWDLKADHVYTFYSLNTTIVCQGFGYILPSIDAPTAMLGEEEHDGSEIKLDGKPVDVTFTLADEAHHIYYHFAEAEEAPAQDPNEVEGPGEMSMAKATAEEDLPETIEHENGKTYTHATDKKVSLTKAGTLSFFAYHPESGLMSEVKEITVSGEGTSGIAEIAVDGVNAPVEYFNIQGQRIDNPSEGIYIRREGNKVSKVVVK